MRFGIHLPQIGRAASAEAIRRIAQLAEELGLDDVWVSDHQVVPAEGSGLSAYHFDPLTALTWAGAATERVGLGTSVLVVPLYPAVLLANRLASLDQLSGGRVILGAGVGWLEAEFRAVGASMSDRGARMDENLDVLRACWSQDPVEFKGSWHDLAGVRLQPQPARPIPVWIGGSGERSYRRAVEKGDGFHAVRQAPEAMVDVVSRLRRDRPEPGFTISVRCDWNGLTSDPDTIRREIDAYRAAGVDHLMTVPVLRSLDEWLGSTERLAALFDEFR